MGVRTVAQLAGTCGQCGDRIEVGQDLVHTGSRWVHAECKPQTQVQGDGTCRMQTRQGTRCRTTATRTWRGLGVCNVHWPEGLYSQQHQRHRRRVVAYLESLLTEPAGQR